MSTDWVAMIHLPSCFHYTVYGLKNANVCFNFNGWYDDPGCENLIITGYDLRKHI